MLQTALKRFCLKTTLILSLAFLCVSMSPQAVSQHQIYFKGFAVIINDDAFDENNNHLLVGGIRAIETKEEDRDTTINKIFDLKGYCNEDEMGIAIATDQDYNIVKIAKTCIGQKVIYSRDKKQFTIGANFHSHLQVGDRFFPAWQPVIVQIDLELKKKTYFIEKPYSCFLDNIVLENKEMLLFTRSEITRTNGPEHYQKAEILRVNLTKFHNDSTLMRRQILKPISSQETPYTDGGRITLSDVSKVTDTYYFTTSNFNQFTLKNVNHLYRFKNNSLTEVQSFPDYIATSTKRTDFIFINGFIVNSMNEYIMLAHKGATKKEMFFSKTDTSYTKPLIKNIPLNDYADFNKLLLLANGNMVMLVVNAKGTWSYVLYDSTLQMIKEVDSNISKEYYPRRLKTSTRDTVECIFFIDQVNKKDCVLQQVDLN